MKKFPIYTWFEFQQVQKVLQEEQLKNSFSVEDLKITRNSDFSSECLAVGMSFQFLDFESVKLFIRKRNNDRDNR